MSTEEQARVQDGSLVSQRKRLEEFVEGQNRRDSGWGQIVNVYVDEGRSAKDMNRPEFQRLLTDVQSGKINLVLSSELSRMSRSIRDFCDIWDLFKKHNTNFITLREQFDTTTAAGEVMVFNLINFAQFERKQTAERITANFKSRAERGLWNGGVLPLGYDRNPKSPGILLINKSESKNVKTIFKTFLKIGSVRKTCLELKKLGIYSKRNINKHGFEKGGGHFTISSLQHVLTNKAYIGLRVINKSKKQVKVVNASWPAIIDLETFNKVQDRLQLNKSKYKPEEWKTYPFSLTEILVCGECGKTLGGKSGHGRNGKHYYYGHSRRLHSDGVSHLKRCQLETVKAPHVEEVILKSLKDLLDDPRLIKTWLDLYIQNTQTELPALEGRLKTMENDIAGLKRKIANLTVRLADLPADIPADPIYSQIKEFTRKLNDFENTKAELALNAQSSQKSAIDPTELIFRLKRTINALEKTPAEDRRPIYSNLIKFAELHPKKIRLGIYAPTFQRPKWPLVLILQMSWVRVVLGLVGPAGIEPTTSTL
ncbi:MAG: recombinase family protein, partial [Bdellovibrionales bacterium]|nr:recombinase family protein [Bdellovibrionales bacterium]